MWTLSSGLSTAARVETMELGGWLFLVSWVLRDPAPTCGSCGTRSWDQGRRQSAWGHGESLPSRLARKMTSSLRMCRPRSTRFLTQRWRRSCCGLTLETVWGVHDSLSRRVHTRCTFGSRPRADSALGTGLRLRTCYVRGTRSHARAGTCLRANLIPWKEETASGRRCGSTERRKQGTTRPSGSKELTRRRSKDLCFLGPNLVGPVAKWGLLREGWAVPLLEGWRNFLLTPTLGD